MRTTLRQALAGLLVAAGLTAPVAAREAALLSPGNYVDVGDKLSDVLVNSGIAFSTLVLGAFADLTHVQRASLQRSAPRTTVYRSESPCPGGGSVHASMHDDDDSGALSSADRFVTVFDQCAVDAGVVTGSSEFVVARHRFEGSVEVTELDFRFKQLGTADLRWSGPARVTLRTDLLRGTEHFVVEYRDLAVMRHQRPMRWNFTLDVVRPPIGEHVTRLNGRITLEDLPLRLHQNDPYVIAANGFPRSGMLTATDARGARLQLEAGRWRYAYRFYRAGNTSEAPNSSSQSRPYGQR